jgi:hypothetical protein
MTIFISFRTPLQARIRFNWLSFYWSAPNRAGKRKYFCGMCGFIADRSSDVLKHVASELHAADPRIRGTDWKKERAEHKRNKKKKAAQPSPDAEPEATAGDAEREAANAELDEPNAEPPGDPNPEPEATDDAEPEEEPFEPAESPGEEEEEGESRRQRCVVC